MQVEEIAAIVSEELRKHGLEAVLSGGSVVTIYSENEYQSHDLDFVSPEKISDLQEVMESLGFSKKSGRHFEHPNLDYFVEFPSAPLTLGHEKVTDWGEYKTKHGKIQILTPTQSVMDRLAGYYAWNDLQNLDQAVMVAKTHPVNLDKIKSWSKAQQEEEKFGRFLKSLKKATES